jgi:hypothetical protein
MTDSEMRRAGMSPGPRQVVRPAVAAETLPHGSDRGTSTPPTERCRPGEARLSGAGRRGRGRRARRERRRATNAPHARVRGTARPVPNSAAVAYQTPESAEATRTGCAVRAQHRGGPAAASTRRAPARPEPCAGRSRAAPPRPWSTRRRQATRRGGHRVRESACLGGQEAQRNFCAPDRGAFLDFFS